MDVATWFHSNNRYSAEASCENCDKTGGSHEKWCIVINRAVLYAYEIVLEPKGMTEHDRCILHALGVAWTCDSTHVHQRM